MGVRYQQFDKAKFKNHFEHVVIMLWLKIIVQSQRHDIFSIMLK